MNLEDIEWKELGNNNLPYEDITKEYGRAEFGFCFTRDAEGYITTVYIECQQQDREDIYWKYTPKNKNVGFSFNSFTHQGVDRPWAWMYTWCVNHNSLHVRVYVPNGTDHLNIEESSVTGISIYFQKN